MGRTVGRMRGLTDALCVGWPVYGVVGRTVGRGVGCSRFKARVGTLLGAALGVDDWTASVVVLRAAELIVCIANSCIIVDVFGYSI